MVGEGPLPFGEIKTIIKEGGTRFVDGGDVRSGFFRAGMREKVLMISRRGRYVLSKRCGQAKRTRDRSYKEDRAVGSLV